MMSWKGHFFPIWLSLSKGNSNLRTNVALHFWEILSRHLFFTISSGGRGVSGSPPMELTAL